MGRKGKVGKQRKDKYYQLAKESGYRSRASFKLIQLNRKFEFLQRSKVLIDLCAAPGGWLQVAQKFMPVSSVIVGVDLVPIKPIPNVITLQEDITTPKCRSQLKKNLKTWKADVVLHDGAPNVGKSWIHDAYEQNRLTLSALHLACDFLIKGGWFITKVFRSKDYNSLMWVLNKLFKKVFATKPQASRNESAEIFVVCQNFIAPDKIEAKFFDPSYVFADLEENEHKITANDLLKSAVKIKKAKAEGYDDGATMLYSKLDASKFIEDPNYADLLSKTSEIVLDNEHIKNHPSTTDEILECIKDIKVLGRKELLLLINWRKELRSELKKALKKEKIERNSEKPKEDQNGDNGDDDDDDENESDVEEIDSFESEEAIKLKRKKKKMAKEKRKLAERMNLKMIIENDQLVQEEQDLFSLSKVLKSATIDQLQDVEPDLVDDEEEEQEEGEEETVEDEEKENDADYQAKNKKTNKISYDKDYNSECLVDPDDSGLSDDDDDDYSSEIELDEDDPNEISSNHGNEDKNDADPIEEEDFSDDEEAARFQELVDTIAKNRDRANQPTQQVDAEELPSVPDEQYEENEDEQKSNRHNDTDKKSKNKVEKPKTLLSAEELALATELIKSKKSRRVLMDDAWNRYTNDDGDGAPSWFRKEEQIYCRKPLPISPEALKKSKETTNSRINKKEMEAKARKKKRVLRRLDRARVKAENLTEDPSMSNKEKADCIRRIYKKASIKKDKQPSLVIAKKQYGNRRPPGVKGRYKIVDSRMKKDKRNNKQQNDNKGKKPKKKNKFFNKNKKQKSR